MQHPPHTGREAQNKEHNIMAKGKKTEAAEPEATTEEQSSEETSAEYLARKTEAIHEGHAAYLKDRYGIDVDPQHVFAIYSTRVDYRKNSDFYQKAKEAREAAKLAAAEAKEAAKAEKAKEREAKAEEKAKAKAEKKAAEEKAKAEKAEADAKAAAKDEKPAAKGKGSKAAAKGTDKKKPF